METVEITADRNFGEPRDSKVKLDQSVRIFIEGPFFFKYEPESGVRIAMPPSAVQQP